MNIVTTKAAYETARKLAAEGRHLEAAQKFFTAQRWAKQCRAAARWALFDHAHLGATMQATAVLDDAASSHTDRSEAGRIRAESQHLFSSGI